MQIKCGVCGKVNECSASDEQMAAWKAGALIQNAMPNVPEYERELLISGYCEKCFDEICRVDNEDD